MLPSLHPLTTIERCTFQIKKSNEEILKTFDKKVRDLQNQMKKEVRDLQSQMKKKGRYLQNQIKNITNEKEKVKLELEEKLNEKLRTWKTQKYETDLDSINRRIQVFISDLIDADRRNLTQKQKDCKYTNIHSIYCKSLLSSNTKPLSNSPTRFLL
ncbi:hypothetical protein DMUE_6336 [Dictyocoela muelleri]|nr:hypothetical protein DMUE_6336 [Dictyocoela muelleri]